MENRPQIQYVFKVCVKDVRVRSAIAVIEEGKLPTAITFHVEPPSNIGTSCDWVLEIMGEDLNRALRLQKSGSVLTEVSSNFWIQHSKTWQEEVIKIALQQFATNPGSH